MKLLSSKLIRKVSIISATVLILLVALLVKPLFHISKVSIKDQNELQDVPAGYFDDASRLNLTKVKEVWEVPGNADDAEKQLRALLIRALKEKLPVSIAGATHSMGGHTISPNGIVIDMLPWSQMELDEETNILKVGAGATWSQIIPYLDQYHRSVAVMQSNNSFSVGGSISVNCHGWQFGRPPIASTVQSFRMMTADGNILNCSREENSELFRLALGGYGLFGVILDVELKVVPNRCYQLEQHIVPVDQALTTFEARIQGREGVEMVYARMNIAPDRFLQDVIINAFFVDEKQPIPDLKEPGLEKIRRAVFRGSVNSDYGKSLRWSAETKLQPLLAAETFSRNQLLNESVEVFQNRTSDTTDILHEYFVPRSHVVQFVDQLRQIIPQHELDLLNVTVRQVNADHDTFLRYADQPMIAFVMLFVQERTQDAESNMQALTRELIDAALENQGRYYLPYRLHASKEQFKRAYPQHADFFALKRKQDPQELFQNQFYLRYSKSLKNE